MKPLQIFVLMVSLSLLLSACAPVSQLSISEVQAPSPSATPVSIPTPLPTPRPTIYPQKTTNRPSATPLPRKIPTPKPEVRDTTPPLAYILEPKSTDTVSRGQTVKVVANVTDNVGVDRVEFYYSSTPYLVGTVKTPPYEVTFKIRDDDYSMNVPIYVIAYDKAGNKSNNPEANIAVTMNR